MDEPDLLRDIMEVLLEKARNHLRQDLEGLARELHDQTNIPRRLPLDPQ